MMVMHLPENRFLLTAVVISMAAHAVVFLIAWGAPQPAVFAVKKAPSSLEIRFVREPEEMPLLKEPVRQMPAPEPAKTIIEEEVITAGKSLLQIPVKEEPVVTSPAVIEPAAAPSRASRGARTEAKPLDHENPAPEYPMIARRRGWEGLVSLNVLVGADGRAGQVSVAGSSGHGILDRAAVKAVEQWRFEPAVRNGRPVSSTIRIPVEFRLERLK